MVDHTFSNCPCRFHRIWLSKQNTRTGQILARIRDMLNELDFACFRNIFGMHTSPGEGLGTQQVQNVGGRGHRVERYGSSDFGK